MCGILNRELNDLTYVAEIGSVGPKMAATPWISGCSSAGSLARAHTAENIKLIMSTSGIAQCHY